ncbi:MAG: efflux RND transporter periplasmic adaptor subunit [Proteobacteria bacterium]|nr:efflux RND transporter periplasmic adaptor subunit [Pseudomonadota bacterium]
MKRILAGTLVVAGLAAAGAAIGQQTASNNTGVIAPTGPLVARGYSEAPAGTVVVSNDPAGGAVIKELRIRDGQKVKRGDVIAVMSSFPTNEVNVRIAENNLRKVEQTREKVLLGTSATDIKLQEDSLKSTIEQERLNAILRERSGRPREERELEVALAEQRIEQQRKSLELSKRSLEIQLSQNAIEIQRFKAALEDAQRALEQSLVRAPIDGVVVQVGSREGELVSEFGIAKIVDMKQLRVFATVDELHLPRLKKGAPVEVTFRGNPQVYKAHVALAPNMVKREKRSEADKGVASVRQVEVEIQADDGVQFPQIIGREARVVFL